MSVLIVGAGPTGLMLAIWLKTLRPTLGLRVVSKAKGPGTTSRAIIIHARTLEYYEQLGIADRIVAQGKILEGVSLYSDGAVRGSLKFGRIGGDSTRFPFVLSLSQERHERILLQYLQELGVSVQWDTEVTAVDQTENVVRASLGNGEQVEVEYLAACDGSHSTVRKQVGIPMHGSQYPARFYVADTVVPSTSPVTGLRLCISSTTFMVCLPMGAKGDDQVVRVLGIVPKGCADDEEFGAFSKQIEQGSGFTFKGVEWSSIYSVHHRVASNFRDRRVFLLGDAAHIHSPVGGQGMNTGLGDASNLAWKLVSALDNKDDAVLDTYEIERRAFAQTLVKSTDTIFHLIINEGVVGFLFRKVFMCNILPLLWKVPFIPPRFFKMVSQLGVSYRESPLSQGRNEKNQGQLQAGDRLPWTGATGVDNHAVLKERRFQVHRYSGEQTTETEVSGLPVHSFAIQKPGRFQLYPEFDYLVRPDGYIASIAPRWNGNATGK